MSTKNKRPVVFTLGGDSDDSDSEAEITKAVVPEEEEMPAYNSINGFLAPPGAANSSDNNSRENAQPVQMVRNNYSDLGTVGTRQIRQSRSAPQLNTSEGQSGGVRAIPSFVLEGPEGGYILSEAERQALNNFTDKGLDPLRHTQIAETHPEEGNALGQNEIPTSRHFGMRRFSRSATDIGPRRRKGEMEKDGDGSGGTANITPDSMTFPEGNQCGQPELVKYLASRVVQKALQSQDSTTQEVAAVQSAISQEAAVQAVQTALQDQQAVAQEQAAQNEKLRQGILEQNALLRAFIARNAVLDPMELDSAPAASDFGQAHGHNGRDNLPAQNGLPGLSQIHGYNCQGILRSQGGLPGPSQMHGQNSQTNMPQGQPGHHVYPQMYAPAAQGSLQGTPGVFPAIPTNSLAPIPVGNPRAGVFDLTAQAFAPPVFMKNISNQQQQRQEAQYMQHLQPSQQMNMLPPNYPQSSGINYTHEQQMHMASQSRFCMMTEQQKQQQMHIAQIQHQLQVAQAKQMQLAQTIGAIQFGETETHEADGRRKKPFLRGLDALLVARAENWAVLQQNINPILTTWNRNTRFFVIKSTNEMDVYSALKWGIWTSTELGNRRLTEALRGHHGYGPVLLLFSVNGSGRFCGVAEMLSAHEQDTMAGIWTERKWKGRFDIRWLFVKDVPMTALRDIFVANNDGKNVSCSRDTQELYAETGFQMLDAFNGYRSSTGLIYDSSRGQMPAASEPITPETVPGLGTPAPPPRWLPNYIDGPAGFTSRGFNFPDTEESPTRHGPPGRGPGPSPYEHAASMRSRGGGGNHRYYHHHHYLRGSWAQGPAGGRSAVVTGAAPTSTILTPANTPSW